MNVQCFSLWNRHQWRFILLRHNLLGARRIRATWRREHFWIIKLLGVVWLVEWGREGIPPEQLLRR